MLVLCAGASQAPVATALAQDVGQTSSDLVANQQKVLIVRNGWFSYRWSQIFDADTGLGGGAVAERRQHHVRLYLLGLASVALSGGHRGALVEAGRDTDRIGEIQAEGTHRELRRVGGRAPHRDQAKRLQREIVRILGVEGAQQRAGQAVEQTDHNSAPGGMRPDPMGAPGPIQGAAHRNRLPADVLRLYFLQANPVLPRGTARLRGVIAC